jgi:hypothetical protein
MGMEKWSNNHVYCEDFKRCLCYKTGSTIQGVSYKKKQEKSEHQNEVLENHN